MKLVVAATIAGRSIQSDDSRLARSADLAAAAAAGRGGDRALCAFIRHRQGWTGELSFQQRVPGALTAPVHQHWQVRGQGAARGLKQQQGG